MHVISRKKLREFWEIEKQAETPLDNWYRTAKKENWQNIAQVRQFFPHADIFGNCVVFNIGGNKYRLITKIFFDDKTVLVRFVLTHKEYDKDEWKIDCKK